MAAQSASLSLMRASFLEQLPVGAGRRWYGVHLPCQRRWVSAAWCIGVSVMNVACLDSRRAGAPSGALVVSMVGLVKGFDTFLHPGYG
jgi:hypothetical protein